MALVTAFRGFVADDFDVFAHAGFEPRMAALRGHLRPRLVALADELAPILSRAAGVTLYPHVAAHMRRTVNPPPETWAAFGPDPRRYKAHAHLALGVEAHGAWLRLVLKDEALADRQALAHILARAPQAALADLPRDMCVRLADGGERPAHAPAGEAELGRLSRKSEAQWAVGRSLARTDPALATEAGVEAATLDALGALLPLWRRLPSWPKPA